MPQRAALVDPIDRIAAVEAHLRAGGFGEYADALVAMREGERFEAALGLETHGGVSWRQRARIAQRDTAYLALGELAGAGLTANKKAAAVYRAARRYAQSADWERDEREGVDGLPPGDLGRRLKFDILSSGAKLLTEGSLGKLFEKHGK